MSDTSRDPDAFRRFQNTMRALLAVPRKELDGELTTWKKRRAKKVAARQRRNA